MKSLQCLRDLQRVCEQDDASVRAGSPGPTDLDFSPTQEPTPVQASRPDFSNNFTSSLTPQFFGFLSHA